MLNFREWLITESSDRVVLMKAVHDDGAESIKKGGFQLQDKHRSVANYYKKYGDMEETQMYGPGLYFTIVPVGQDHIEYAKKNCKMYAKEWGNNIVFATIKSGSRGLVTGFPEGHAMWGYSITKEPYIYNQLEALGVNDIIGYKKGEIHTREEWGYKLHDKIDFWAHSHWAEGGAHAWNVVVYNPSILQSLGTVECEPGMSKPAGTTGSSQPNSGPARAQTQQGRPNNRPAPAQAQKQGNNELELEDMPDAKFPPAFRPQQVPPRNVSAPAIQRRRFPPGTEDLELEDM